MYAQDKTTPDDISKPHGAADSSPAGSVPLEPAALSVEELEELKQKAAQYDECVERSLRMRADFDNSQKRIVRETQARIDYAIELFAEELLPVSDNLARAILAAMEHDSVEKILEGVQLVEKQLHDTLSRHGVTPIETKPGQPFDPNEHQAMSVIPAPDQEPNTIVQEIQRGFRIHKRLLRPAHVIVSASETTEEEAQSPSAHTGE